MTSANAQTSSQTKLEKELELAREKIAAVQANPNVGSSGSSISYAVAYVTDQKRCDDKNYKRAKYKFVV